MKYMGIKVRLSVTLTKIFLALAWEMILKSVEMILKHINMRLKEKTEKKFESFF